MIDLFVVGLVLLIIGIMIVYLCRWHLMSFTFGVSGIGTGILAIVASIGLL